MAHVTRRSILPRESSPTHMVGSRRQSGLSHGSSRKLPRTWSGAARKRRSAPLVLIPPLSFMHFRFCAHLRFSSPSDIQHRRPLRTTQLEFCGAVLGVGRTKSPWGEGGAFAPRAACHNARDQAPTSSMISSCTRAASAWPRVAFMTAPTRAPAACTFPPRIFSTTSGFAARAS